MKSTRATEASEEALLQRVPVPVRGRGGGLHRQRRPSGPRDGAASGGTGAPAPRRARAGRRDRRGTHRAGARTHVAEVVAYDVTPQMLTETARNAAERGLTNVVLQRGAAEHLLFPAASFDIVTVRHAPHHFVDAARAVREMARVAKPGGRVVIVDSRSPEDPALDREFNYIEKLRDPSHVRNYRPSQWRAMVTAAGLRITFEELDFYMENGGPMDFAAWTARANTPPAAIAELTRLLRDSSPALVEALRIEVGHDAIGFCVPQITIAAVKD